MIGKVLEINQSKKYAGRTYVKWVLLEIHESEGLWNKNGITWKEKFVQDNIESVKSMPIAAQFLDSWEKDEPHGHGFSDVKDNEPLFEDSEVVGSAEKAYIDTIEINGENKKVLIAEGYLYHQRYPKFVKWLKAEIYDGNMPETSVEICAQDGQDYITYESGWHEEGRIPMKFDFSGSAILGIAPADDSAVLLELNQKRGDKEMAKDNEIIELSQKLESKNTEINNLKESLSTKDSELESVKTELNSKTEEVNGLVDQHKDIEKELNSLKEEKEKMDKELSELHKFKQDSDNEKLKSEMNTKLENYTDEEKKVVESEINEFEESPSKEKMDKIISDINSSIAQKLLEQRKNNVEVNNNKNTEDIFGDIFETNNENDGIDDLFE